MKSIYFICAVVCFSMSSVTLGMNRARNNEAGGVIVQFPPKGPSQPTPQHPEASLNSYVFVNTARAITRTPALESPHCNIVSFSDDNEYRHRVTQALSSVLQLDGTSGDRTFNWQEIEALILTKYLAQPGQLDAAVFEQEAEEGYVLLKPIPNLQWQVSQETDQQSTQQQ